MLSPASPLSAIAAAAASDKQKAQFSSSLAATTKLGFLGEAVTSRSKDAPMLAAQAFRGGAPLIFLRAQCCSRFVAFAPQPLAPPQLELPRLERLEQPHRWYLTADGSSAQ